MSSISKGLYSSGAPGNQAFDQDCELDSLVSE